MRIALLTLAVLSILGLAAGAQNHTGGYFGVTWAAGGTGHALKSDMLGKVTSMRIGMSSHYECEIASDNKLVLVSDHTTSVIWQIDPVTMTITGTLMASPVLSSVLYGLEYDHNGDLYAFASSALYRLTPPSTVATVTTGSFSLGNAALDLDTAELLIASGSVNGTLKSVDRWSGTITTLATGLAGRYGDAAMDPLTGDVFVPTCCGSSTLPRSLDVVRAGQSVSTVYLASTVLLGAYGVVMDRVSAAAPRMVTGCFYDSTTPASGGIWYVDVTSATPQKLASFTVATVADVCILEARNIHTTRTGPGRYTIDLSFPAEGSRGYVLGLGYTGIRPTFPLSDGRRIPLIVDPLTVLAVQGQLAPLVTGTVGGLDPFGRATARMDLSPFYPAIRGVVLWMVAVTLDSKAPLGLATISNPFVLKVD